MRRLRLIAAMALARVPELCELIRSRAIAHAEALSEQALGRITWEFEGDIHFERDEYSTGSVRQLGITRALAETEERRD